VIALGIHAYTHDSAAALVRDGEVVAAAEEERFNGVKHTDAFPSGAIGFCLERAGIGLDEVDEVAISWQPWFKLPKRALAFVRHLPRSLVSLGPSPDGRIRGNLEIWNQIRILPRAVTRLFGPAPRTRFRYYRHHDCHAASAFLVSPFASASILSCDACGEWDTTALYHGKGASLHLLESEEMPDSVGLVYGALTQFLGFKIKSDEGKVMALAALGEPRFRADVRRLVGGANGSRPRVDTRFFRFHFDTKGQFYSDRMAELFGPPARPGSEPDARDRDLAASLQEVTEEAMIGLVRRLCEHTGLDSLCLAGGVALNSKANGRLLEDGVVRSLFVQPAANDAGTALGAALLACRQGSRGARAPRRFSPFLGPGGDDADTPGWARELGLSCRTIPDTTEVVAELLARGETVGWHQGRMEFGPRALGNRSILADPRRAEMKDHLNARVKFREPFRPFAPAVLDQARAEYFAVDHPVPHMTAVLLVRPAARERIPAAVHADGTARVQTCGREDNPLFADLIAAFGRRTGVPVLLNTSLNLSRMPIAATPRQSLRCLVESDLDFLCVGDLLVWKKDPLTQLVDEITGARTAQASVTP